MMRPSSTPRRIIPARVSHSARASSGEIDEAARPGCNRQANSASDRNTLPAPATTAWSSRATPSARRSRPNAATNRSGSASSRNGSGPSRPHSAGTPASSRTSHVIGAMRSHATAESASRTRTDGRGSGDGGAERYQTPRRPRWVGRDSAPKR
jgi:hypothetical protein